jgi:hypothetical protein
MKAISKEEAKEFRARWALVNEFVAAEVQRMSLEEKLNQTAVMFGAAQSLEWSEKLRAGEDEVRERWMLLRKRLT